MMSLHLAWKGCLRGGGRQRPSKKRKWIDGYPGVNCAATQHRRDTKIQFIQGQDWDRKTLIEALSRTVQDGRRMPSLSVPLVSPRSRERICLRCCPRPRGVRSPLPIPNPASFPKCTRDFSRRCRVSASKCHRAACLTVAKGPLEPC